MVNQLNCLRAGGLVLGIVGTLVALINVFYAVAIYENFSLVEHNFIMNAVIGDAPEHIIRLTYVINAIFDLVAAALLIAGILMVIIFRDFLFAIAVLSLALSLCISNIIICMLNKIKIKRNTNEIDANSCTLVKNKYRKSDLFTKQSLQKKQKR